MLKPIEITDLQHFAGMLGLPLRTFQSYFRGAEYYYKTFRVRKRSGHGYRIICAPSKELKGLQRWIMVFVLRPVDLLPEATAFRPGCSILRNAVPHVAKDFVFNADIADFFPSITTHRVVGLFKRLGYSSDVAYALGRLTTYRGSLPQGAPSSPDIANIICRGLDARLVGLCKPRKWSYTRYCDDISISGHGGIGRRTIEFIYKIIADEDFLLNPRKTTVLRSNRRQVVTGLVVNEKAAVSRHVRKKWRAIFHQARLAPSLFKHRVEELEGYIGLLSMVCPNHPPLTKYREVLNIVKNEMY